MSFSLYYEIFYFMEFISNDHMFSRAGKSSTEKFRILSEKERIISRRIQFKAPSRFSFNSKQKQTYESINKLAKEEIEKLKKAKQEEKEIIKHQTTYSFNVQSRDDYYETKRNKDKIPPPGWYNISYTLKDQKYLIPKLHPEKQEIRAKTTNNTPTRSSWKDYSFQQADHIPSAIPFHKQQSRESYSRISKKTPNEKRFLVNNLTPTVCSKYKRTKYPDMTKYLPRDDSMYNAPCYNPQYNPNKEVIMENLGKVVDFDKMLRRQSLFDIKDMPDQYDASFDYIDPHKKVLDFGKSPPRFQDDVSPMSFTQTVNKSRQELIRGIFTTQSNPVFALYSSLT
ncbi:unnamed protein product [Blepharisma stoltei]|uniref:Uncharacterized protein n=1 Tax=Blepharisma stoltei TaxID=1481888 RepID=A0AAU9JRP4_9CILI|nr:unnamed protein product [Blepharisma stoltei]